MAILTLDNVTYRYKDAQKPAVSSANCAFEAGKLYAIVGPSGSGKSTLLSMLAGLGEVKIGDESLAALDLDFYRRKKISIIFQAFHLFPLLTVLENVCFPLELSGIAPKDAKVHALELLASVGISKEQAKRFPSKLSGGEQQRVAIARSLSTDAKILLADEPTGNLDAANSQNIMEILHGLAHDSGYCVIIVTHDMEIAEKADKTFKMKDGVLL
jgi:putative ABC transport system ATP-binding protein